MLSRSTSKPLLSFVIPCLNEALCLEAVINDCHRGGEATGDSYEIVVADNGSSDDSQAIAARCGARVLHVAERGYGAALRAGIQAAEGDYVLMGDADGTYNFVDAPLFLAQLQLGHDLVMGNRFRGTIEPGSMPFLHQWLGNPVLSGLGRLLFGITIGDFHCGLRAFRRSQILSLDLRCDGMEFASEMVIKASLRDLRLKEVPTTLRPDHPERKPHLRTWRDGWRHLKFMLSFSPKYAFLTLSIALFALAALSMILFVLQLSPFTGPNTLVLSAFAFLAGLGLLSDYLTTRVMFADAYGKPLGVGLWLNRWLLKPRHGVDRLYQIAAATAILGVLLMLMVVGRGVEGEAATRSANLLTYGSGLLLSLALFSYLTAAKISTIRSLAPRSR